MLNQVVLVGRLTDNVIYNEENEITNVTIIVPRNYKNGNGEYDNDIITCQINGSIAKNTAEYCKKNDIIGIRGRIETVDNTMVIKVEKLTFLSNKKQESEEK